MIISWNFSYHSSSESSPSTVADVDCFLNGIKLVNIKNIRILCLEKSLTSVKVYWVFWKVQDWVIVRNSPEQSDILWPSSLITARCFHYRKRLLLELQGRATDRNRETSARSCLNIISISTYWFCLIDEVDKIVNFEANLTQTRLSVLLDILVHRRTWPHLPSCVLSEFCPSSVSPIRKYDVIWGLFSI